MVEEDVAQLGEELQRLTRSGVEQELDEDARRDLQVARDCYEDARAAVAAIGSADQIPNVLGTLNAGRHALACWTARVEGRPAPESATPCFFNPQHGPASAEVLWTRPGRGTRAVPACAVDAARSAAGEQPEVRMVYLGARRVPYWEAGEVFQSYARGYFATRLDSDSLLQARRDHKAYTDFAAWPGTRFDGDFGPTHP
jgi:hypothetical protein